MREDIVEVDGVTWIQVKALPPELVGRGLEIVSERGRAARTAMGLPPTPARRKHHRGQPAKWCGHPPSATYKDEQGVDCCRKCENAGRPAVGDR